MRRLGLSSLVVVAMLAAMPSALAGSDTFDSSRPGTPPIGWTCGVTGGGSPNWTVERDASAPSPANVLVQSGSGIYPWCVKNAVSIADGFVEVRFKAISGREDRAGGLVWRWKDRDNYYVARANALENNVSLYHTEHGQRMIIQYVDAPVASNQWHLLRVDFSGSRVQVILDGKGYIEVEDRHITGLGSIGVWTKADSVTAFGDFSFGGR